MRSRSSTEMTRFSAARLLDRAEQAALAALFSWLLWRLLPEHGAALNIYSLALLISEGIVLLFVLTRHSTGNITSSPKEWVIAFGGTTAALLVEGSSDPFLPQLGLALLLIGLGVHLSAKLVLRRSFGVVAADRGVKISGPYNIVRHPMYLGYAVTHIGFFLAVPSVWNGLVYAVTWTLLLSRIMAEERMLMRNAQYQEYQTKVPHRLIPLVW